MRIFIIMLLSAGVFVACGDNKTVEPDPVFGLVGYWVPDNGATRFFYGDRLLNHLVDDDIDSLTAHNRLRAMRAMAEAYLPFERIRLSEIRDDGVYFDTKGYRGRWAVGHNRSLTLIDIRGRQIEYQYTLHYDNESFDLKLDKQQFTEIMKQLVALNDDMLLVIDRYFDDGRKMHYYYNRFKH